MKPVSIFLEHLFGEEEEKGYYSLYVPEAAYSQGKTFIR